MLNLKQYETPNVCLIFLIKKYIAQCIYKSTVINKLSDSSEGIQDGYFALKNFGMCTLVDFLFKLGVVHLAVTLVVVIILYFLYLGYFKMRTRSLLKFLTLECCIVAIKTKLLSARQVHQTSGRYVLNCVWRSTTYIN